MDYNSDVVDLILEELGIEIQHISGGWGTGMCPLHSDTSASFTVNLESGGWRCYSGCGSSRDLAVLVSRCTGEKLGNARRRLRNLLVNDPNIFDKMFGPKESRRSESGEVVSGGIRESLFYERGHTYNYLLQRGFTLETIKKWEIGIDSESKRVVIPFKREGKLIGLIRRRISDAEGKATPKYLNSFGIHKRDYLFGLDLIPQDETVLYLTEGPLDAIWLDQHYYSACATLGASISDRQAELIRSRFYTVVLCYDIDAAGNAGIEKAKKLLGKLRLFYIKIPDGCKDVQDIRDGYTLAETLANAKEFVL